MSASVVLRKNWGHRAAPLFSDRCRHHLLPRWHDRACLA
jgi:hypothetical protein